MDYPFLIFVVIIIIIAFSIGYFRKEKLTADFYNTLNNERDNIILEIRGIKGKQNRVRPIGECSIDLFLTNDRLYINTRIESINQIYPSHPLILTRKQLNGHKKCKLMRINTNSYSNSMFFSFIGTSKLIPDEIRIFDLTTEQKQLIDRVIKTEDDLSGLYVYYLEKTPE